MATTKSKRKDPKDRKGLKPGKRDTSKAKAPQVDPTVEIQGKAAAELKGGEHVDPVSKIGHPKKRAMIQALRSTLGLVSPAVKKLEAELGEGNGISRATHYQWLIDDPLYKAAVEAIAEEELDFVESKLRVLINGVTVSRTDGKGREHIYTEPPDTTAIMFYLNNKGGKRDYGNRIEVKHTGGKVLDPDMPGDE